MKRLTCPGLLWFSFRLVCHRKFQVIPELTKLSNVDLCFKKSLKALCVIYLKEGRELTPEETDMLESFKYQYDSSKGPDFRFMWMDVDTEKGFKELFDLEKYPSLVVFNPHLKTRFTRVETEEVMSIPMLDRGGQPSTTKNSLRNRACGGTVFSQELGK